LNELVTQKSSTATTEEETECRVSRQGDYFGVFDPSDRKLSVRFCVGSGAGRLLTYPVMKQKMKTKGTLLDMITQ
jgi:hypothetical protein